jgi:MFS transporter, ACS family, pantothenate transporter
MWNNVINAWWPLVFYPATDAPWFTKGMWAMIGTAIATLAATALVWYLERREKRVMQRSDELGSGKSHSGDREADNREKTSPVEETRESHEKTG